MVDTLQSGKPIDFSIMPSFRCNLHCWFCMYDASPENNMTLNLEKTREFLVQFDWKLINAFGFYGGEPSIDMPLYDKFITLIPKELPRFVITNGVWSRNTKDTFEFLQWCANNKFHIIVSSTPEHLKHQNRSLIVELATQFKSVIELKEPDEIHAQGRAKGKRGVVSNCKLTCQRTDRNIRLGLKPDGNIVFQNCHGEYHIIQSYNDPFEGIIERTQAKVAECFKKLVEAKE